MSTISTSDNIIIVGKDILTKVSKKILSTLRALSCLRHSLGKLRSAGGVQLNIYFHNLTLYLTLALEDLPLLHQRLLALSCNKTCWLMPKWVRRWPDHPGKKSTINPTPSHQVLNFLRLQINLWNHLSRLHLAILLQVVSLWLSLRIYMTLRSSRNIWSMESILWTMIWNLFPLYIRHNPQLAPTINLRNCLRNITTSDISLSLLEYTEPSRFTRSLRRDLTNLGLCMIFGHLISSSRLRTLICRRLNLHL